MARRKTLTDVGITALKPRIRRYAEPDPELVGHYVRVTPAGAKSFCAVSRDPAGRQVWATIGPTDLLSVEEARERARAAIKRIRSGLPAIEKPTTRPLTFGEVANQWLRRHVEAKGLRAEREIRRLLNVHVMPRWQDREFVALRRSDVVALLDAVEDDHSPRQADAVLTWIRAIAFWFAARHDDYQPPIVRGMRRQDPKAQQRERVLDDDELRALWLAAEQAGAYGAFLRLALLTAQREAKIIKMRWTDLTDEGEWIIPREPREKPNAGSLLLPTAALAIIKERPRLASNPFVFAGRGEGHFRGFSQAKVRFDEKLGGSVRPWRIHDLRRTARSLMSRAGVRSEIAERVLGHLIGGVEGIYDRHSYRDEKADALARLANLIDSIIRPSKKVVPMRAAP